MTGRWRKSSYSTDQGNCVEAADLGDGIVGVRDSKDPEGPVLHLSRSEFGAWISGLKAGEFDDLA